MTQYAIDKDEPGVVTASSPRPSGHLQGNAVSRLEQGDGFRVSPTDNRQPGSRLPVSRELSGVLSYRGEQGCMEVLWASGAAGVLPLLTIRITRRFFRAPAPLPSHPTMPGFLAERSRVGAERGHACGLWRAFWWLCGLWPSWGRT